MKRDPQPSDAPPPQARSRRLQFGLAALVLLQTAVAIVLGIWRGLGAEGIVVVLGGALNGAVAAVVLMACYRPIPGQRERNLVSLAGWLMVAAFLFMFGSGVVALAAALAGSLNEVP